MKITPTKLSLLRSICIRSVTFFFLFVSSFAVHAEEAKAKTAAEELSQTKSMLRQSFERNKQLMDQNKAYEDKLMKLIGQVDAQDKQVKELSQKLAKTMDHAQNVNDENKRNTQNLEAAEVIKSKAVIQAKELLDIKTKLEQTAARNEDLSAKLEAIQKRNEELIQKSKVSSDKAEMLAKNLEETSSELAQIKTQVKAQTEAEVKLKSLQETYQSLEAKWNASKGTIEGLEGKILKLEEENKAKSATLTDLQSAQEAEKSLKAELHATRLKYDEAQEKIQEREKIVSEQSEKMSEMQEEMEGHAKELEALLDQVKKAEDLSGKEAKVYQERALKAEKSLSDLKIQLAVKTDETVRLKKRVESEMTENREELQMKQRLLDLQKLLKLKETQIQALQREAQGYVQNIDKLQEVVSKKDKRLGEEISVLKKQNEPLNQELKSKDEKIWILEQSKKNRDEEIITLQKKYELATSNYESELNKLSENEKLLKKENLDLTQKVKGISAEFSNYKKTTEAAIKERETALSDLKIQVQPLQTDLEKTLSELRIREKRINDLGFSATRLQDKVQALQKTLTQREEELKKLTQEQTNGLTQLEKENEELEISLKNSKSQGVELQVKLETADAKIAALEKTKTQQEEELRKSFYRNQNQQSAEESATKKLLVKKDREIEKLQNRLQELEHLHRKDRVTFLYNLGVVYTQQGLFKEAKEAYEKALEIDPKDISSHYNLGILYEDHFDDSKKALPHYEAFVALSKDQKKIRQVEGWIKLSKEENVSGGRRSRTESARDAFDHIFLTNSSNG